MHPLSPEANFRRMKNFCNEIELEIKAANFKDDRFIIECIDDVQNNIEIHHINGSKTIEMKSYITVPKSFSQRLKYKFIEISSLARLSGLSLVPSLKPSNTHFTMELIAFMYSGGISFETVLHFKETLVSCSKRLIELLDPVQASEEN